MKIPSMLSIAALAAAALFAMPANAKSPENDSRQNCNHTTTLYSALTSQERNGNLTPVDSNVLSSPHYCVGYLDKLGYLETKPGLTEQEVRHIRTRYNLVWSNLKSDDEKVAFAHRFLKAFSQDTVVYAKTGIDNQITIVIPGKVK